MSATTEQFINFGFDWQQQAVEMDLNNDRVRQHLKALIRGCGSSTENILVDFVKNTHGRIAEYGSVESAWNRLDAGQKEMVIGFRALMNQATLGHVEQFPLLWFRALVSERFGSMRDQYEAKHDGESAPLDLQSEWAEQAESEIRAQLNGPSGQTWVVDSYDD